jgi:hypothetical protein
MATKNQNESATVEQGTNAGTYTVAELSAHAQILGSKPDIVTAALRTAKVTECTIDEARRIVEKFCKKEGKR